MYTQEKIIDYCKRLAVYIPPLSTYYWDVPARVQPRAGKNIVQLLN